MAETADKYSKSTFPSLLTNKTPIFWQVAIFQLTKKKPTHFPFSLAMVWLMKYRWKMLDGVFWNIL